jgi:hypothetical protein
MKEGRKVCFCTFPFLPPPSSSCASLLHGNNNNSSTEHETKEVASEKGERN